MIDTATHNLILVHFPPQSGGKFLTNCLALSDACVFAKADLIRQQLHHKFDLQDKLAYLRDQLAQSAAAGTWNDLDLGCWQMFGMPVHPFGFANPDLHFLLEKYADPVMHELSARDLKWFMTTHETGELRQCLRYWCNCKVIIFVNFERFLRLRNQWLERPSHLFYHELFEQDTEQIRQDLAPDRVFAWDCDWYLDPELFRHHFVECSTWLGLDQIDTDALSWYRNSWIHGIMEPQ